MTKDAEFNKMTRKDMMAWGVTVLLALACLIVPEQGIYTHEVKLFLAITVFCLSLAAFEIVPNMIVAMLLSGLYIASGCAPASVAMSPWVSTTSLLVIGALFMAATLQASGLLSRIAYRMMCWAKGNYFVLMIYILIISVVLNIMTSGYAYMIMGPLCLGLCISMDGVKKKLGAGIAAAVMIGGCTSHAYTYQVAAWAVIYPWRRAIIHRGMSHRYPSSYIVGRCFWSLLFYYLSFPSGTSQINRWAISPTLENS